MVDCVNHCTSKTNKYLSFGTVKIDPVEPIAYGQTINISIPIIDHSMLYGESVSIDVSSDNIGCIYHKDFYLNKGETRLITFPMTMPNDDLSLTINAMSFDPNPLVGWTCEEILTITIKQKFTTYDCRADKVCIPAKNGQFSSQSECIVSGCIPPAPKYTDYNCVGGICAGNIQTGLGQFASLKACTDSGCKTPVGTGTGVTCPTGQTNLSGLLPKCYPKSDIYIGIAGVALLYIMTKK